MLSHCHSYTHPNENTVHTIIYAQSKALTALLVEFIHVIYSIFSQVRMIGFVLHNKWQSDKANHTYL